MTTTDAVTAPTGRRLSEQGAERRQQIVDAAIALFTDKGYEATRISDICQQAGVAKGLFYWYFPTKLDVFVEVATSMRRRLRRAQGDAFTPGADALTHICEGASATVTFMAQYAHYFALVDAERADPAIRNALNEAGEVYHDDLLRLVREGQRDATIDDRDPELLVVGVLGAVAAFTNASRAGAIGVDVDELARFVADWVRKELAAGD